MKRSHRIRGYAAAGATPTSASSVRIANSTAPSPDGVNGTAVKSMAANVTKITATGGHLMFNDDQQTPNVLMVIFEFPNPDDEPWMGETSDELRADARWLAKFKSYL